MSLAAEGCLSRLLGGLTFEGSSRLGRSAASSEDSSYPVEGVRVGHATDPAIIRKPGWVLQSLVYVMLWALILIPVGSVLFVSVWYRVYNGQI